MNDAKLATAVDLILQHSQYDAARKLLLSMSDDPRAQLWLKKLDRMTETTQVTQPVQSIQSSPPRRAAQKEFSEMYQERHPYLGVFNFLGGFVGFISLLGGIQFLTGLELLSSVNGMYGRGTNAGGILLFLVGLVLLSVYFWVRRISHKFHSWSTVPMSQKAVAWLTTLLVGFVVALVILPAIAVGVYMGIGDIRRS